MRHSFKINEFKKKRQQDIKIRRRMDNDNKNQTPLKLQDEDSDDDNKSEDRSLTRPTLITRTRVPLKGGTNNETTYDLPNAEPSLVHRSLRRFFSGRHLGFSQRSLGSRLSRSRDGRILIRQLTQASLFDHSIVEFTDEEIDDNTATIRRVRDFRFAQERRFVKYGETRAWGILGIYHHLADIRTDIEWANDAAWRRENQQRRNF